MYMKPHMNEGIHTNKQSEAEMMSLELITPPFPQGGSAGWRGVLGPLKQAATTQIYYTGRENDHAVLFSSEMATNPISSSPRVL
jgi:hypothetical protein